MKSLGTFLIILSVCAVIFSLIAAFMPEYLLPAPASNPQPLRSDSYNPSVQPLINSFSILYYLPLIILLAVFVQVLGWGMVIVGMLQDQQPVTASRIGR